MIMWIMVGYVAASTIASLVFYGACVAAGRADRVVQQTEQVAQSELAAKRTKPLPSSQVPVHA